MTSVGASVAKSMARWGAASVRNMGLSGAGQTAARRHYSLDQGKTGAEQGGAEPAAAKAATEADAQQAQPKIITSKVVEETNLHGALKRAFQTTVGETLTPVQEQCINEFVSSKNGIVVRAKTGTGKTFAFGIPVLHSVLSARDKDMRQASKYVNSVVFSPTRDLAFQTRRSLSDLWTSCLQQGTTRSRREKSPYFKKAKGNQEPIPLVIGQTPYRATMSYFVAKEAPPVVVATPGRFMDMLENEPKFRSSFKHLQNIIIDEADELLNGNFKEDINRIIDELVAIREPIPGVEDKAAEVKPKTMLFSATVNDDVFDLAERAIGEDFPFVDVTGTKTKEVNENITQTLVQTDTIFDTYVAAVKFVLDHANNRDFKPIIFLSTTSSVDFVSKLLSDVLRDENIRRRVLSFHGKLTQGKRDSAQRIFRENDKTILVASGIGARGMDFPNVSHVIQIGVSSEIDSHTHKIGRTGRAGRQGDALLFTSKLEEPFVRALKKNGNKFFDVQFDQTEPEAVEVAEKIKNQTRSYLDLDDTFFKSLTHYRNIPGKVANLNLNALAVDVAKTYNELANPEFNESETHSLAEDDGFFDDEAKDNASIQKLTMSYTMAKNMGLDFRKIEDYYTLTGRRPSDSRQNNNRGGYSNNRNSKRNDWSRNGRNDRGERNNRNDRRDGKYGGNRNRNDRNDDERKYSRW